MNSDLSPEQYEWFRDYVARATAIVLDDGKEYLVQSRLEAVLKAEDLEDVDALIRGLTGPHRLQLHGAVVDAMTTNETSFFRDQHPFEALREELLPSLIESRSSSRQLRIWCAAASSGQEPYTLAMLLAEHFPELRGWSIDLHATDISEAMLEKCREGRFSQLEIGRGLPAQMLVKYFRRDGTDWVVVDELRERLKFSQLNLAEPWPQLPQLDLVLMRNVLIYFGTDTKKRIFEQLSQALAPDGYLMLGAAETTTGIDDRYSRGKHGKASYYTKAS